MILADWDRAAGRRRGAGVVSIGAASASILAEAGAHIDCERFVRAFDAMVAAVLKRSRLNFPNPPPLLGGNLLHRGL